MGNKYGIDWYIDDVPVAMVIRSTWQNGQYQCVVERCRATLEQIEAIDWSHPTIVAGKEQPGLGLPEGYGFDLVGIEYHSSSDNYTITVVVAKQFLGDVTGYVAQVEELQQAATEKDATIAQQATDLATKEQALANATTELSATQEELASANARVDELVGAGTAEQVATDLDAAYTEGVESNG